MLALEVERTIRLELPTPAEAHVSALSRRAGSAYMDACRSGRTQIDRVLQHAVASLVGRLRSDGAPPERVVVALKHALADGDAAHKIPSLVGSNDADEERERRRVYQLAFRWFLDAYYGELRPGT